MTVPHAHDASMSLPDKRTGAGINQAVLHRLERPSAAECMTTGTVSVYRGLDALNSRVDHSAYRTRNQTGMAAVSHSWTVRLEKASDFHGEGHR